MALAPSNKGSKDYQYETDRGTMYVKFWTLAKGAAHGLSKGGFMSGESGLLGARIVKIVRHQKAKEAQDELEVHYESITAYAAPSGSLTAAEIKGSRRTWGDGKMLYAEQLYVSDDANCEVTRGTTYPGDSGDAEWKRRVALTPRITEHNIPSRWFHQILYIGYIPHASGTNELKISGRVWEEGNRRFAERLFITTDGARPVAKGTVYAGDSGDATGVQRVATVLQDIPEHLPGRTLHRVTYTNYIPYSAGVSEVKGSRRTWTEGRRTFAERLFCTTNGSSGVSEGDAYPGDSGVDAKYAFTPQNTLEVFPSRVLSRVLYQGLRSYE